jgi:hypothetical protein
LKIDYVLDAFTFIVSITLRAMYFYWNLDLFWDIKMVSIYAWNASLYFLLFPKWNTVPSSLLENCSFNCNPKDSCRLLVEVKKEYLGYLQCLF